MAEATSRFAQALDSRGAYRLVQALAIGALVLSLLVGLKQFQLTNCLAEYNDARAKRDAIVTQIAAEDRRVDVTDRAAVDRVEAARGQYDLAWTRMLQGIAERKEDQMASLFTSLLKSQAELNAVRDEAQKTRTANAATRAANEKERADNPLPPPPSQRC